MDSAWLPEPSSLAASSSLPMKLKGRYRKLILTSNDSEFLFKFYSGAGEELVMAAEITAAEIFQVLDPSRSVPVAEFHWEDLSGSIQPYMAKAKTLPLPVILEDDSMIEHILRRQVVDWVLSNHDAHINHILWEDSWPLFVDYGQAFKYFPKDIISKNYYPNAIQGQLEPVYNFIHRHCGLIDRNRIDLVLSFAASVSSTAAEPFWELLRPYAEKRFSQREDRDHFMLSVRNRVSSAEAAFEDFFKERT